MDTRKLLVADASASFCSALTEALGGAYELRICHDGLQAIGLLESFRPDVLVTDLALPGLDGISVLKAAASRSRRPALLVTTRFCSPFIESAVSEIGVDYLVFKPCDIRALVERIHDLSQCDSPAALPVRTARSNILLTLGVPAGRKGYAYLEEIIELYRLDPGRSLTKDLYPAVGSANRANGVSVERAIRGAIQTAWERRNETVWRLYFTPTRDGLMPRPTNRVFIATVAEVLGMKETRYA